MSAVGVYFAAAVLLSKASHSWLGAAFRGQEGQRCGPIQSLIVVPSAASADQPLLHRAAFWSLIGRWSERLSYWRHHQVWPFRMHCGIASGRYPSLRLALSRYQKFAKD
jgi:hypothetical protein